MDPHLMRGLTTVSKQEAIRFPASSLVGRRRREAWEELPRGPSPSVTTSQVCILPLKFRLNMECAFLHALQERMP